MRVFSATDRLLELKLTLRDVELLFVMFVWSGRKGGQQGVVCKLNGKEIWNGEGCEN